MDTSQGKRKIDLSTKWLKQTRAQNVPVGGDILMEKAQTLASKLNIIGFEASRGWLEKFKHRHGIRFKMEQGEAGAVDVESLARWQGEVLRSSLVDYSPNDIFNVDETGLFWKVLLEKTMAFQGLAKM
uniref:HTH CENPB-type domain-containing protein n=1 Tax=Ditylenchus dipsaci TaxID=166011 RepID=A0A915EHX6_9BILA